MGRVWGAGLAAAALYAYVLAWQRRRKKAEQDGAADTASGPSRGPATAAAARPPPAEHPHAALIEALSRQPPLLQLPPREGPPGDAPLGSGKGEYAWVAKPSHLAAAAMELFEQDRLALDVEHHNTHSYAGVTCLLQISTGAGGGAGRRC